MTIAEMFCQQWNRLAARYLHSQGQLLSVDLGVEKITAVLLEKGADGVRLIDELIEFRSPAQDNHWWKEKLSQWIQQKQWKTKKVSFVTSGVPVVLRRFQIPKVASSELKNAIHWQIKDQLPFPIEEAVVEYRLIGRPQETEGASQVDVLVAAAPKTEIKKWIDQLEGLGLEVKNFGLIPSALESGIRQSAVYSHQTIAVLEMGAETSFLAVIGKAGILFYRQLQVTGKTITESLTGSIVMDSGRVDISFQQAEEFKKKYGIPGRNTAECAQEGSVSLNKLGVMMRPALEKLSNEIHRTLEYYQMQYSQSDQKVTRLLLSGGTGQMKGLAAFLKESLNLPVDSLDLAGALLKVTMAPERSARLNVTLGLAFQGADSFNLLPLNYRLKSLKETQAAVVRIGAVATGFILALFFLYQHWNLKQMELQLSAAQGSVKNMGVILDIKKEIEQRRELAWKIRREELLCPGLMAELSRMAPANLLLDEFTFDQEKKELLLKGIIYAEQEESQEQLSDFIQRLQNCQGVTQVRLTTTLQTQQEGQDGARFEILCKLES